MLRLKLFLIFLMILIIGCDNNITGNVVDYESNVNVKVYFCPQDDCDTVMKNVVDGASNSVHCAFWDLDLKDVIKTFGQKSHSVDVKLVLDERNYDGQIKGDGVKIVKSKQYMHNKFCILDDSKIITGSMNPTDNGANKNNNNLVIIKSEYISSNYEAEFQELWNGVFASGDNVEYKEINTDVGVIETYFCPEDCKQELNGGIYRIIDLVRNADKSVKVASFSFTHEELGDELVKADIKGKDVKVLVETRQRNVLGSQYSRLRDFGIEIKVDGNKNNMHHKFVIIDDKIIVLGSTNLSLSGNNRNDENMLIIFNKELALGFSREFDRMFMEGEVVY
jgi:cardiolipin synthase A/B